MSRPPSAVAFDLDGVLVDSEQAWDDTRRQVVDENGGRWVPGASEAMMGMSSPEWSRYLHDELGVRLGPDEISTAVASRLVAWFDQRMPLLPHAVEAVRTLAARWPLGLASSANRPVIEHVLDRAGLRDCFRAIVSSEEVPRGKPSPDVYLAVAAALEVRAADVVAVEDSANGIRSALAAGMRVVAVPNPHFPPPTDVLERASRTIGTLAELTPELVADL